MSVVYSLFSGGASALTDSVMEGAKSALTLIAATAGMMCFWSGIMEIARSSGITEAVAKVFKPVFRLLIPEHADDKEVCSAVSMNISANLLGLGNAATPLGIRAMSLMQAKNGSDTASNSMVMFVVLNTASLQLVPTTIAVLRAENGSNDPMGIITNIWLCSVAALIVGISCAKVLGSRGSRL
ncbi:MULTISPECIES: nucleoside recognition domain-containing protein [unclassified Ruminococcus]|uniref:nucleoside recognition domain-containing protein n=1 Tax=unclassified Ruminococcus TaxID=2608920 RepID=UPI00210AC79E|nr:MULTISPECIES: nucleoside recognition domain-containing protein [unclassified Ruminococcus]